jgi:hypothetical protein
VARLKNNLFTKRQAGRRKNRSAGLPPALVSARSARTMNKEHQKLAATGIHSLGDCVAVTFAGSWPS